MSKENWLIVGISGATCSGKSTIAKELHSLFPRSVLLHQDDYFYDVNSEKHTKIEELNHINFEIVSSVDMMAFKNHIQSLLETTESVFSPQTRQIDVVSKFKEKFCTVEVPPSVQCIFDKMQSLRTLPSLLIIEGFLVLNDEQLEDLCDVKFYLTLRKSICWERRKVRVYEPPDVPGYFEKYVWPSYITHYEEVLSNGVNVNYMDGADSIENNLLYVVHRILDYLK